MTLTQKLDNINWSLIFERPKTVEEKGRGRGREEEEKRRRKEDKKGMDSSMDLWIFVWNFV